MHNVYIYVSTSLNSSIKGLELQYILEIFHLSYSRYVWSHLNWTYSFDIAVLAKKTISYLGSKTWNNLLAKIKLSTNVNTFKHEIKKLFLDELQKQNNDIFFYYYMQIKFPLNLFFNFLLHVFFFICLCQNSSFVSLYSQRDHNGNYVYLDLYYAISVRHSTF